ncbi:N-acetylneuraminate synthase family protein [Delftia sp. DLF01]|uniref:N-acetylneuraminate synthase family protein n=1 Tax=Delftia sp. DLF01 TaxID=2769279 RepID=UPI00177D046C|nr:N-acetylneuraminate synthase family protein [Delftia sp. DLF01]MBD9585050.1 N-acetylneuraminate synthase family protein [Delftia sp. DLF01]
MNSVNVEKLILSIGNKKDADIAIIGKGASIDAINLMILDGMIVINANDSESIYPGDIGVFHHGWVLDRFEHVKPQCNLYVTDRHLPLNVPVLSARYISPEDEDELFIHRFFDESNIWLERSAVINCLRIANEIAKALKIRKRVFLLGFDFSIENGFSTHIENGFHGAESEYIQNIIKSQEKYLEHLLSERDQLSVDVAHIGSRPYSLFTVNAFNALRGNISFKAASTIDEGDDARVKIVAEITTNHFGDKDRLMAMIRLAKKSGADYIKLQKRDVETFYDKETLEKSFKSPFGKTFRSYRLGLELSKEDFRWVDGFCKEIGIGWFASILDEASFDFIKEFNPQLIKIPSTISNKTSYLKAVGSKWNGGIVISTGMTGSEYEVFIAENFSQASHIYLLQCTSAYPTPENDTNIGVVRHYRDISRQDSRIIPGYSSHDVGSLCSQLAVAAGAKMIEKHVKLGSVQWAHFDDVALDLSSGEFEKFVSDVRRAEKIVGCENKSIVLSEHHKY